MKYDFDYKKTLGQNFLIDKNIIDKIVGSIDAKENDLILEIGPGAGALTKKLVNKTKVIAFEIDTRLEEVLSKIETNNLRVIFEDFLKVDIKKYLCNETYNKLYVVGNLPYYITTAIIKKIIDEIIKILASNNLTIEEAKNILHNTIKGIECQKVSVSH